jgi:hypothetical protein
MKFLTTQEASAFLKSTGYSISPATLTTMRTRGGGPQFIKTGMFVRYDEDVLCEWVAARTRIMATTREEAGDDIVGEAA